jgi:uncharacterized protein YkwD
MRTMICRRVAFVLFSVILLSGSDCGSSAPTTTTPAVSTPVTTLQTTPPTCGNDGTGVPSGTMSGNELTLANLINSYRTQVINNLPFFPALNPDPTCVGVAQFHAADMAAHGYVGLVASDGEDALTRIVCSNSSLASTQTGVIAVGVSSDPNAVFAALNADLSASQILYSTPSFTSLSVGYNSGYWMIILSK